MSSLLDVDPPLGLPSQGSFSGHETFPFRYAWPKKGIDGLRNRSDIFQTDEAMVDLGVGKNMVRSIRHWCLATQIIEESDYLPNSRTRTLRLTEQGEAIFVNPGYDPYLEDDATLWLLHWWIVSNALRATTWYWAFNLMREQEFTRDGLAVHLERLAAAHNWSRVATSSIKSDVSCFLRTYVAGRRGPTSTTEDTLDCPLTNLDLLLDLGENRYRFNVGPKGNLPSAAFLYALLDFWRTWHPNQRTLNVREVIYGEGSPGRVFKLDDDAVLAYCDEMASLTAGRVVFSDTALSRQMIMNEVVAWEEVLDAYYAN